MQEADELFIATELACKSTVSIALDRFGHREIGVAPE